ncbi:hypothetical protein KPL39_15380 [Clostridium gasigenes]|uniref:DUF3784 domain-containing protein n=1 Tax=Clostridium gasigenes TaxID=94869 RepID=A0A7X0VPL5_9CLOT|nr:hypothetical protein [Clostridium gasigenes]MBB6713432.1 hypothetical protein [Clostridium gasigenes]MBU3137644.1 hypothetical protein [Clostridium gasigenes]
MALQILGIFYIIVGLFAIIFKTYPSKNISLNKLKDKYGEVDDKRLALFDGVGYLILGIIIVIIYELEILKYKLVSFGIIFIFIITAISYNSMRKKFLGFK